MLDQFWNISIISYFIKFPTGILNADIRVGSAVGY
jgi:hypothetical protein